MISMGVEGWSAYLCCSAALQSLPRVLGDGVKFPFTKGTGYMYPGVQGTGYGVQGTGYRVRGT